MQTIRAGNFELVVDVDGIAYVSGSIALADGGIAYPGRLGEDMDIETGQASARGAAEAILAALHQHLGSCDRVVRVVRLGSLRRGRSARRRWRCARGGGPEQAASRLWRRHRGWLSVPST